MVNSAASANSIGMDQQQQAPQPRRGIRRHSRSPSLLSSSIAEEAEDSEEIKAGRKKTDEDGEDENTSFQEEFIRQRDTTFESEFIRVLGRLQQVIERNELRLMEKDRRNAEKLEWQQVALVLDRFFLVLFAIGTLLVLLLTVFSDQTKKAIFGDD